MMIQSIKSTIKPNKYIVFLRCQGLPAKSGGGYLCLAVLHTSGVHVVTKFSLAADVPPFVLDTDNSIPFSLFLSPSLRKLGLSIYNRKITRQLSLTHSHRLKNNYTTFEHLEWLQVMMERTSYLGIIIFFFDLFMMTGKLTECTAWNGMKCETKVNITWLSNNFFNGSQTSDKRYLVSVVEHCHFPCK